ncbi:MAG: choice-of-anchor B family protein [Bacteroidetes bacterium]|nr:choice-of-anchor B family protein [Bacteroidota bacterium]
MRIFVSLIGFLLLFSGVHAQALTLHQVVNFPFVTNSLGDVGTSDCWGYTDSLGVDYAVVGNSDHVAFVRASDGLVLDTIQLASMGDGYFHRAIVTKGHHCYVVGEMVGKRNGLATIDMQFLPDSVHFVGADDIGGTMLRCHELDVDPGRDYLYMEADEILGQQGIEIFNISDRDHPFKEGFISVPNTHDMTARNDTVWVAEGYTPAFSIWNCADKGNPIRIGRITDPSFGYCHGIFPSDDGKFFFTTEETPNKTVKVWDAHDLNNIFLRGQYLGNNNLAHNVYVMGNLLVFSHYTSGVTIVDWSDPDNLVEIAAYDTYPQNEVANFYGTWAAFPWTANGYIYASNFEGKLFILNWDPNAPVNLQESTPTQGQCWPNPMTSVTNIPLELSSGEDVLVQVFSSTGECVETVFSGKLNPGKYTLPWHPGSNVANGIYILKVKAGENFRSEKIILTR